MPILYPESVYNSETNQKEPLVGGKWENDVSSLGDASPGRGNSDSSDDDDSDDSGQEESSSGEDSEDSASSDDDDSESDGGWTDGDGFSTDLSSSQQNSLPYVDTTNSDADDDSDDETESDEEEEDDDSSSEEDSDDEDGETSSDEDGNDSGDDDPQEQTHDGETFDDEPWGKVDKIDKQSELQTVKSFKKVSSYRDPFFDEEIGELSQNDPTTIAASSGGGDGSSSIGRHILSSEKYGNRSRLYIAVASFCCCIIIIIAVVVGVTAGGGKDGEPITDGTNQPEPTPAPFTNPPRPNFAPSTSSPSISPVTFPPMETKLPIQSPTISPAPSQPIAEELTFVTNADTYLTTGVLADNGQADRLQVGQDTVTLISFDTTDLPGPKDIYYRDKTAMLQLRQVIANTTTAETRNATTTLRISRLPSTPLSIEALESNPFGNFGGVGGPIFEVSPSDDIIQANITMLLFDQPPFSDFDIADVEEQAAQETQLFLVIQYFDTPATSSDVEDIIFHSRESNIENGPPQLIVGLQDTTTEAPTKSPAPSTSYQPSLRPTKSPAPTSSQSPTVTQRPSQFPTFSSFPTDTKRPTAAAMNQSSAPTIHNDTLTIS